MKIYFRLYPATVAKKKKKSDNMTDQNLPVCDQLSSFCDFRLFLLGILLGKRMMSRHQNPIYCDIVTDKCSLA